MSASAMPYCGRPADVLSILTAITGPSLTGPPVNASTGAGGGGGSGVGVGLGGGVGVGVRLGVGDADDEVDDELGGASDPVEHPASTSAPASTDIRAVIRVDRPTGFPPGPSRSTGRGRSG